LGFKKNIFNYINFADCLISTALWEDPGFTLVEAGILNKLVISSDCPSGPIELFNQNNGYLFKSNSQEDFVKKFIEYKNDSLKKKVIAIRREDQSLWERRAPLSPNHVRKLVNKNGFRVLIQPSNRRAFQIQEYIRAGAEVSEDLQQASLILGVKQVPIDMLLPNKTYVFFSHTIKAQEANMPLLDALLEKVWFC
jgi:glycosyltransferase involved in cell wall biosynthesis